MSSTAASDGTLSPARSRLYMAGRAIDAVGSGLWIPVSLLFFVRAQHLPLSQVGSAMTVGMITGLVAGPYAGSLVDRLGPAPIVVGSNVVRAIVFTLYPMIRSIWLVTVLAMIVSASDRMFWTANTPLLAQLNGTQTLAARLSTLNVIRVLGIGAGAGLAGLVGRSESGMHLLAYANGASFALAAAFVCAVAGVPKRLPPQDREPGTRKWYTVMGDRAFLLLCLTQVIFTIADSSFTIALPLVIVETLREPMWLAGASVLVANIVLVLTFKPALAYTKRTSQHRALTLSSIVLVVTFLLMAPAREFPQFLIVPVVLFVSALGVTAEALQAAGMSDVVYNAAPKGLKGRYNAVFQLAYGVPGAIAPAMFTWLLVLGNTELWLMLAIFATIAIPLLARTTSLWSSQPSTDPVI
jgi:MFS family permease